MSKRWFLSYCAVDSELPTTFRHIETERHPIDFINNLNDNSRSIGGPLYNFKCVLLNFQELNPDDPKLESV